MCEIDQVGAGGFIWIVIWCLCGLGVALAMGWMGVAQWILKGGWGEGSVG